MSIQLSDQKRGRSFLKTWFPRVKTLAQSSLLVGFFILSYKGLQTLGIFWISLINSVQSGLVFGAMIYFYKTGGKSVRKVVTPIGFFSVIYFSIFTTRVLFYSGERLPGEWGKIGSTVANYIWFPVWFYAAYLYWKGAKDLKEGLQREITEVRSILDSGL